MIGNHWLLLAVAGAAICVLWLAAVLNKYIRLMLNILRQGPPPLLMSPLDFPPMEGQNVSFRAFDGTVLCGMFLTKDTLAIDSEPCEESANDEYEQRGESANDKCVPSGIGQGKQAESLVEHSDWLSEDSRGVIVFCHEYSSDKYSSVRYCQGLLDAGYVVFTFDFRSHGKSKSLPGYQSRLWCTDKEVADCLGAVSFVQEELDRRESELRIGLFGISRGAGAAIIAAATPHLPTSISAVLADSVFSNDSTIEYMMKKWAHIFARVRFLYDHHRPTYWRFIRWLLLKVAKLRFNCEFLSVRKSLSRLTNTATFFIHGAKDSYIRHEQTEMLYERAHHPKYLWLVKGAKHNQSVVTEHQRYKARTVAFFEKYLALADVSELAIEEELKEETAEFFGWKVNRPALTSSQKATCHVDTSTRPGRYIHDQATTQTI